MSPFRIVLLLAAAWLAAATDDPCPAATTFEGCKEVSDKYMTDSQAFCCWNYATAECHAFPGWTIEGDEKTVAAVLAELAALPVDDKYPMSCPSAPPPPPPPPDEFEAACSSATDTA